MRKLFVPLMMGVMFVQAGAQTIIVGSKKFTESYVLGEIAKRELTDAGFTVEHKQGMGGTIILWEALNSGQISMYPEYTGTITEEILKQKGRKMSDAQLRSSLANFGVGMTDQLGFNNTYALVMTSKRATQLGIKSISDLVKHKELKVGVTHEFLDRQDGWKPLAAAYGLPMSDVKGIDHGLGYEALAKGDIDVKDAYSTDAKIAENNLVVLNDDLNFFPQYRAVFLYLLKTPPKAVAAIEKIDRTLDETRMTALNAEAEKTKNYAEAASLYFKKPGGSGKVTSGPSVASHIAELTVQHLELVFISLLIATVVGIPLGILAWRPGALSAFILGAVGVIQTIPSLALLAFLVPLMGIHPVTAIVALFLYSLLPIVRNTATGLQEIPPPLRESAAALGLPPGARLQKIFMPMASRSILAGIKTSAVINVGTATLAALIGAGGLGEPIISGLNLNDVPTIMQGAIPAAVLAVLVQLLFDGLDKIFVPKGLRISGVVN